MQRYVRTVAARSRSLTAFVVMPSGCTNTKPRAYDRTGTYTQKHSE